ncbi:MAG TPA: Uma2 family endonuclease [Thermomicrobiales bacterium]
MAAQPKPGLSEEEYLRLERESEVRHEYLAGEIVAMVGASKDHNRIVTSTSFALYAQLRHRPCDLFANDMRVKVGASGLYTYPDLTVVCGEPLFFEEDTNTLLNPTVIIEVLSPSTEGYDRGKKFQHYRGLRSLKEYLLISQDAYHIDQFVRHGEINWLLTEHDGPTATVHLTSIDCTLALADLYEKVDVPS